LAPLDINNLIHSFPSEKTRATTGFLALLSICKMVLKPDNLVSQTGAKLSTMSMNYKKYTKQRS